MKLFVFNPHRIGHDTFYVMSETIEKLPVKRQGVTSRQATYIGVDVPPETKEALMRQAEKQGRPLASFVRRALEKLAEDLA